jgi:hypothetical protein
VAELTIAPRGHATDAAGLLDASADDRADLAARQLAAMQGIGYALLALGDQVADLTDASTDLGGQLGDISDHVGNIAESLERHRLAAGGRGHWPPAPSWFKAALAALRAGGAS